MSADYEYWLFDLDGTIVDVERRYILDLLGHVGEDIGYRFTDNEAVTLWRALGGPPEAHLARMGIDPDAFWSSFHKLEEPERRVDATFLYGDAEAIGALDAPVGLVTHCQPYLTRPVLRALDIEDWFDTIVCCHDGIGWKPDPRPIERAMAELGVNGNPGAMTGDTPADIGAAWNAGIDGIHIERVDPSESGRCVRADTRIRRIDDLVSASPSHSTRATDRSYS